MLFHIICKIWHERVSLIANVIYFLYYLACFCFVPSISRLIIIFLFLLKKYLFIKRPLFTSLPVTCFIPETWKWILGYLSVPPPMRGPLGPNKMLCPYETVLPRPHPGNGHQEAMRSVMVLETVQVQGRWNEDKPKRRDPGRPTETSGRQCFRNRASLPLK